jgi:hypothetical protein
MNESKGECCSKIPTIRFRVTNFEKREEGLEKRLGIETRGVEHEENHNSRGNQEELKAKNQRRKNNIKIVN